MVAVYIVDHNCQKHKISFCVANRGSPSGWFPVPDTWKASPFVLLIINFDAYWSDPIQPFAFFIVIAGFQAFLTLGLHCLDLLVSISIDEDIWRTTASARGYNPKFNSILNMAKSWKYVVIFVCKPVVHWLYGLSMTATFNADIVMRPAQLLYLSIFVLVIAGGATLVARRGRSGPQPVTFGHIQTIVDLVDEWVEWDSDLHWGHKNEDPATGLCIAGTSPERLPAIMMGREYL